MKPQAAAAVRIPAEYHALNRHELSRYRTPSQQHFYMEPQAAVAVPEEDGCLTVHSATQSLDAVQASVAQALGMPANKVNVGEAPDPASGHQEYMHASDLLACAGWR